VSKLYFATVALCGFFVFGDIASAQDVTCASSLNAETSTGPELITCMLKLQERLNSKQPVPSAAEVASALLADHLDDLRGEKGEAGAVGPQGPKGDTGEGGVGASLPVGTIVAWYAQNKPIPAGWSVCDGTNGTPDLRGKFLRGVGSMSDAGLDPKATETHRHSASVTDATKGNNNHQATCSLGCDDMWASLYNHNHLGSVGSASNIPPNFKVVYLMKAR